MCFDFRAPVVTRLYRQSPLRLPGRLANVHAGRSACQGANQTAQTTRRTKTNANKLGNLGALLARCRYTVGTAWNDVDSSRMGSNKQRVLILRIKSQRPDSLAGQAMLLRIDTRPA